jgi:hypothetical protein
VELSSLPNGPISFTTTSDALTAIAKGASELANQKTVSQPKRVTRRQNAKPTAKRDHRRINDRWYVRYWQRQTENGEVVRKRVTHCLGDVVTQGKNPPPHIRRAAADHMREVNRGVVSPEQTVSIADFVEDTYLPWAAEYKRPSTVTGYRLIWQNHLKPVIVRDKVLLKYVRTYDVQRWLDQIGKEDLGKNSLSTSNRSCPGFSRWRSSKGFTMA